MPLTGSPPFLLDLPCGRSSAPPQAGPSFPGRPHPVALLHVQPTRPSVKPATRLPPKPVLLCRQNLTPLDVTGLPNKTQLEAPEWRGRGTEGDRETERPTSACRPGPAHAAGLPAHPRPALVMSDTKPPPRGAAWLWAPGGATCHTDGLSQAGLPWS